MNVKRDPDAILVNWLEEGPTRLPDGTRRAIAVSARTTRQARRSIWSPWRYPPMNAYAKLVLAAVVVVAVGAIGIALLGPNQRSGVGAAPSPSPTTSPTPTPLPTAEPLTERFTSNLHGLSVAYPAGWKTTPAIQPWPPGKAVDFASPESDVISDPVRGFDLFLSLKSQPIEGSTPARWLADMPALEECSQTQPVTIDGVAGTIGLTGCDVAFVVDQGRGYVIRLYTGGDDPWVSSAYDRAWFEDFLATVSLQPEDAVSPSASPSRAEPSVGALTQAFTSPTFGYSMQYPAGWTANPTVGEGPTPGGADDFASAAGGWYLRGLSRPVPDGAVVDDWVVRTLQHTDDPGCSPPRTTMESVIVDGHDGRILGFCGTPPAAQIEATVVIDKTAYLYTLFDFRGTPNEAEARALFDRLMTTIKLDPASVAGAPSPSPS